MGFSEIPGIRFTKYAIGTLSIDANNTTKVPFVSILKQNTADFLPHATENPLF